MISPVRGLRGGTGQRAQGLLPSKFTSPMRKVHRTAFFCAEELILPERGTPSIRGVRNRLAPRRGPCRGTNHKQPQTRVETMSGRGDGIVGKNFRGNDAR